MCHGALARCRLAEHEAHRERERGGKGKERQKEELSDGEAKEGGGADEEGEKLGHQQPYTNRDQEPQGQRVLVRWLIKYEGVSRLCVHSGIYPSSSPSLYFLTVFRSLTLLESFLPLLSH